MFVEILDIQRETVLFIAAVGPSVSEVSYAQGQSQGQGMYSQSYNPSWRNHPNLSYKNNQNSIPFNTGQSGVSAKPFGQQSVFNYQKQQDEQNSQTSKLEEIMKMQVELMNKMNVEVHGLKESIRNLNSKMESICGSTVEDRHLDKLPSQPEPNPKAHCGAISSLDAVNTRSGVNASPILPIPRAYLPPALRNQQKESEYAQGMDSSNKNEVPACKGTSVDTAKIPFPERLEKTKDDRQFAKFLEVMKDVQIMIPIFDAVMHMPMYAKFLKDLLTKKRNMEEPEVITLSKECSAIIQNSLPTKLDDPGSFCVPCRMGENSFSALCDLGSSVSVLQVSVSKIMQLGELKPTAITLQLADRSLRRQVGILEDVPVTVGKISYPVDFIVLDMSDKSEAIILGRPFLATAGALIDVKGAKLTMRFGEEEVMFDMKHPTHIPYSQDTCMRIDTIHSCVEDIFKDKSRQTVEPIGEEGCHFAIYQIADDKGCNGKELNSHMKEMELKPVTAPVWYYKI